MSILAVGTLQPRKNLMRLIQAFERLAPRYPDIQLVLCGAPGWHSDQTLPRISVTLSDRIRHLGYVPDSDLPALYSSAAAPPFHPFTKDLGCPRWKRWHAEPRSSPRIDRRYPKFVATRPSWSIRLIPNR